MKANTQMLRNTNARSQSIDALRGWVMVLMALDHVRDFFSNTGINPTDFNHVGPSIFLTRWVTHLCAPVFVFLTGLGAYLSFASGKKTKGQLSVFLIKRGLWMIFLELTFIRLGWFFNLNYEATELQVFWVLGFSMLVLAALVHFPLTFTAAFGFLVIVGHNAFDSIQAKNWGDWAWLWTLLHERGPLISAKGFTVSVLYPLVPWIGVTAIGYVFGALYKRFTERRYEWLAVMGISSLLSFAILRAGNLYGDPNPWSLQSTSLLTVLSFVNVAKYPPSLQYLLVMLGIALLTLSALEKFPPLQAKPLVTLGRVPLFYYVLHLFLIHFLAVAIAMVKFGTTLPSLSLSLEAPAGYGYSLPIIYGVWLIVLLILYPACTWFAEVKRKNTHPFFSYL